MEPPLPGGPDGERAFRAAIFVSAIPGKERITEGSLGCDMLRALQLYGGTTKDSISRRAYALHSPQRAKASSTASVPLSHPIYQIWGSNTDVGKTLIGVGLFKQACLQDKV